MHPTEQILLVDVNRELIKHLLEKVAADIWARMAWVKPCLGDSLLHPGQTAIVFLCEDELTAAFMRFHIRRIRDLLVGAIPFAEIRIEGYKKA